MISPNDFKTIDDYLFGLMEEEQEEEFERMLVNNPKLKAQVALTQIEHETMELAFQSALRADLSTWKLEKKSHFLFRKGARKGLTKIVGLFAAAATISLALGFWFIAGEYSNSALSNRFFGDTSLFASRSISVAGGTLLPGLEALTARNYQVAIDLFEKVQEENNIDQAKLLIGAAYYQMERFHKAEAIFRDLKQNANFLNYRDQAEWQLALTYLAQKSTAQKGEDIVRKIASNPDHSHYPDAQKLIEKKQSFWGMWF